MRTVAILVVLAASCTGQIAPLPQADSPEEFDAYLAVLDAHTPSATIASGDAFVRGWPASPLCGHVYELEFEAYRQVGDISRAIETGEKSLASAPDNLIMLANLAVVLANGTSDANRLERARMYARKAIALSGSIRIPRSIRPGEWAEISARVNSQAHTALGLVANEHGDTRGAIKEFEAAVAMAPSPDATQYNRLGLLYRVVGRISEAKEKFRRAAELPEPAVQALALRELDRLDEH
jgi:tetratricopeptide (TPR) repeat protein